MKIEYFLVISLIIMLSQNISSPCIFVSSIIGFVVKSLCLLDILESGNFPVISSALANNELLLTFYLPKKKWRKRGNE